MILVALEAERDVEHRALLDLTGAPAMPQPSASMCVPVASVSHSLSAPARGQRRRRRGDRHPRAMSTRRRVADAARLEVAQQRLELVRELAERDLEIDAQLGDEIVRRESRAGDRVESRRELGETLARDRDAGRRSVAAEAQQQIAATGQPGVQIERARSSGPIPSPRRRRAR